MTNLEANILMDFLSNSMSQTHYGTAGMTFWINPDTSVHFESESRNLFINFVYFKKPHNTHHISIIECQFEQFKPFLSKLFDMVIESKQMIWPEDAKNNIQNEVKYIKEYLKNNSIDKIQNLQTQVHKIFREDNVYIITLAGEAISHEVGLLDMIELNCQMSLESLKGLNYHINVHIPGWELEQYQGLKNFIKLKEPTSSNLNSLIEELSLEQPELAKGLHKTLLDKMLPENTKLGRKAKI